MTEASEILSPELSDEFTLTFDGQLRDIVMHFALLRELARRFPGPQDPQLVFHDELMFEDALICLLIPRDEKGKPTIGADEIWSLDDHEIKPDEAIKLVKWAMEHLIGFFLSKLSTVTTLGEAHQERIEALLSSLPGLKALASKTASAGPTAFRDLVSGASTGASPTETSEPT